MSTLYDIATWATVTMGKRAELLDDAIGFARDAYLVIAGKVPFEGLSTTSAERAVSTTDTVHSLSDLDPRIAGITSVRMTYSSGVVRRLTRAHVRSFDTLDPTRTGRPTRYARWGEAIEFDRLADSADYTYRLRYWSLPTISTETRETTLVTPPEWDELVKWETLYRLYSANGEHDKALLLVQPTPMPRQYSTQKTRTFEIGILPRLWNDLLQTYQQREAPDEDYGINPVVRRYTAAR